MSLLIHLGYLGYDDDSCEIFIPNKEILDEFKASTKTGEWSGTFRTYEDSLKLLEATWNCDEEAVAELYDKDIPANHPEFKHHTCKIERA